MSPKANFQKFSSNTTSHIFPKLKMRMFFIKCFCKQQFDLRRDQRNFIELKPFLTHIDNYHRNVFQYPGNIHGPKSVGCEKSATKPRENVLKIKRSLKYYQTVKPMCHDSSQGKVYGSRKNFTKQDLNFKIKYK